MRSDLWVIWIALVIAFAFAGFGVGGWFPVERVREKLYDSGHRDGWETGREARAGELDRVWRDGYEQGARDELDSCVPAPPWPDPARPQIAAESMLPTKPLARGAGVNFPPVTTAPCQGESDGAYPSKGDSPGPGLPTVPIFDELAASWPAERTASSSTLHEPSAPAPVAGPPPGDRAAGAETEPPAPVPSAPGSAEGATPSAGAGGEAPGPAMVPGETPGQLGCSAHETAGPGADPWQDIASRLDEDPNLNQWSIGAEVARCHEIVRELHALGKALKAPYQLTPWKGQTA